VTTKGPIDSEDRAWLPHDMIDDPDRLAHLDVKVPDE
jgi:hypothetical protein